MAAENSKSKSDLETELESVRKEQNRVATVLAEAKDELKMKSEAFAELQSTLVGTSRPQVTEPENKEENTSAAHVGQEKLKALESQLENYKRTNSSQQLKIKSLVAQNALLEQDAAPASSDGLKEELKALKLELEGKTHDLEKTKKALIEYKQKIEELEAESAKKRKTPPSQPTVDTAKKGKQSEEENDLFIV